MLLLDVCPLTLGVETHDTEKKKEGVMSILIPRNTILPVKKTEMFTTAEDDQTVVSIKVFEGKGLFHLLHLNVLL